MVNESITGVAPGETVKDSESIEQFTKNGMQSLMELLKASNSLPIDQWDFFKTFPAFNNLIVPESNKILEMLNTIFRHQHIHGNIKRREDDEKYEMIIEGNDAILERVDCNLDELQGLKRNPEPVVGEMRAVNRRQAVSLNYLQGTSKSSKCSTVIRSLTTTRLNVRPQIKFKDKIDNRNIPFEPRIKEKPNALKPLSILLEKYDDKGESFSHPYEYELDMFKPPEDQLKVCEPQYPKSIGEVPLIFVDDLDTLNKMMEDLKTHKEIAVDVEHHSYRSFQGFTCLLQISTREIDYIIDALKLRHELYVLNEVFTNPKVVKVLHGADSDIEWLQRDLCVYIVNMFDTYQAAQLLNFPRLSLAHLLKVFCNIDSNKQFQLFDWRTRPLPEEAVKYAREDTHYLLYIYDKLKNILIEKGQNKTNLLESVINRSTEICKKKYWKNIFTENSHMEFYRKVKKMFDNRQMYALKHLYQWRDKIAREEDESIMYVLPNHMLLNIVEALPREIQGISALCNPVPPLVRQHEREIHKIIFKAREQSLVKPVGEGEALNQSLEMCPNWVPVNVDSKLYCPHDFSHSDDDIRDDLPTLLQHNLTTPSEAALKNNRFFNMATGAIDVFSGGSESGSELNPRLSMGKENYWKFVSPYQRYQKVMAFVQSKESEVQPNVQEASTSDAGGPSPAKIPKLSPPEKSNSKKSCVHGEIMAKSNSGESRLHSDSADNLDSTVYSITPISSESGNSVTNSLVAVASQDDNSSGKKRMSKKKKKTKDGKTLGCSTIYDKDNDGIISHHPSGTVEGDSNLNRANNFSFLESLISLSENNETVIPNCTEEGEIVDDVSTYIVKTPNSKKSNAANKSAKKKKMVDTEGITDKKKAKTKDDFQPYNYSEVDYSSFQSTVPTQNSKKNLSSVTKQQGRRTPWLGNKKNMNIKNTFGNLTK